MIRVNQADRATKARAIFARGCALLLLIPAAACGGNGSPTTPAPITVTPAVAQHWNMTVTFRSVTAGDVNCFADRLASRIGVTSGDIPVVVTRAATAVTFYWGVPSDDVLYTGQISGDDFTANAAAARWFGPSCTDGNPQVTWTEASAVNGRFSAGGTHLEATDVRTFRFPSDTVTLTSLWRGDLQP